MEKLKEIRDKRAQAGLIVVLVLLLLVIVFYIVFFTAEEDTIEITSIPADVNADEPFNISWHINGELDGLVETELYYGTQSVSDEEGNFLDVYEFSTGNLCETNNCSTGNFTVAITLSEPGTFYFRARALIDTLEYWSQEKSVIVNVINQTQ